MRVLQVNTFDAIGGAARIARNLFEIYRDRGHESWLAVGHRDLDDERVVKVPNADAPGQLPRRLAKGIEHQLGIEDFHFPGTRRLLELTEGRPDVVHAHNLHGGYFDLRALPWLSGEVPVLLTLHDAWLLSGHCGHSLDCERWTTGCGSCPYLAIDPPVRRDATAFNWRRKRDIYRRSRLHVSAPSRWLLDRVGRSMLADAVVDARVIPNGVDRAVFRPGDPATARAGLGLPSDAAVLLIAGTNVRHNTWKDFATLQAATILLAERLVGRSVVLVALGSEAETDHVGGVEIRSVPYEHDPTAVAAWYRAADVYVHAARAETFPNSIIEALACGTPVVATAVGGIPEQVADGENGFLVPPGDAAALADRLARILGDDREATRLAAGAALSGTRYDLEHQADTYLEWYKELVKAQ
jgi:glycosyltransferase involved in cell wall biosynthesis